MGPSSIADAQRQRAVASARGLLKQRTLVFAAVGSAALIGSAALSLLPTRGHARELVALWLLLSAVAGGWLAACLLRRRRPAPSPGLAVNVVDEPDLYAWVVDLSHRVGVSAPGAIRLAPATGAWLDDLEGDPTLVLGAASIGWLTRAELERVVGIELTTLRVREDDTVLAALRMSRSLRLDRLCQSRAPVIGLAIRRLGHRLAERCDELRDACVAWALDETPAELTPTDADVKEAALVDEGWELLADRWLTPAGRQGVAPDSVVLAHRELLRACEENGLVERELDRDGGPLALALLADPVEVDLELAACAAAGLPSGEGLVGWDEYVERVALPSWRQTTVDAVAASSEASGRAQPATIDALVKTVDAGLGVAMGIRLIERRESVDGLDTSTPTERHIEDALAGAVAAAASLALVEWGLATPAVDILWGVRMLDGDDQSIDLEPTIRSLLAGGETSGLRHYLKGLGLDTGRTLPLGDAVVSTALPAGLALIAWRGWRPYDVVVTDGFLRAYRQGLGRQLRGVVGRLTGSRIEVEELDPELADSLAGDDPADQPHAQIEVSLADIRRAELYRSPRGTSWTLRLECARDVEVKLSGLGDAHLVSRLLDGQLGDRIEHTGLSLRPNRFAATLGKLGWYTILGGVFVLLAGAVGLVNLLDASRQQTDGSQAVQVVATFGVFGAALIAIGLVPYRFIARRGHHPGLR